MDQLLSDSVAEPRFYGLLLSSFAVLALVLAIVRSGPFQHLRWHQRHLAQSFHPG